MMSEEAGGEPRLELRSESGVNLIVERLRDGRIALATTRPDTTGSSKAGELTVLSPRETLTLSGWFARTVESGWLETVRERIPDLRRTSKELFGDDPDGEKRLALAMLDEIPPGLLRRAFVLLINSIGPASRERLVERLNTTDDFSEEAILRMRLAEEQEAFGYAIAAAALFDLLERRASEPEDT